MASDELLLIDLSALAHQLWHVSGNEPDPNFVSIQLIARIRGLAMNHPYAAICCDNGKSFRKDLDPTYKAQRDTENRAPLRHQMTLACETLQKDGFPIWSVPGYEADDVIATATREALAIDGDTTVQIASADKDLLQLVSLRVTLKKTTDGALMDVAAVRDKYKVGPDQIRDLLCLVGDTSDNIVGAKGIGAVKAAELLNAHGTIAAVYDKMTKGVVPGITPAMRTNLMDFKSRWPLVSQLVTLKDDAPIPFYQIATERTAPPMDAKTAAAIADKCERAMAHTLNEMRDMLPSADTPATEPPPPDRELDDAAAAETLGRVAKGIVQRIQAETGPVAGTPAAPAVRGPVPVSPDVPVEWHQQLEPRTMPEAVQLAQRMFDSRLFGAYGTPQAVLATVLAGRELGFPAMASLRAFHIIEGKPTLSAGAIQSLVLKSGHARYFRCIERSDTRATFETQRGDDPPVALTFTIEEGRRAWPRDDVAFQKSGWGRNPADMCVARASTKLARLVYPDVVLGLYAVEEFD